LCNIIQHNTSWCQIVRRARILFVIASLGTPGNTTRLETANRMDASYFVDVKRDKIKTAKLFGIWKDLLRAASEKPGHHNEQSSLTVVVLSSVVLSSFSSF